MTEKHKKTRKPEWILVALWAFQTWEQAPWPFSFKPVKQECLEFLTDPDEGPNLTAETAQFLHELGISSVEMLVDFAMERVLDVARPEQLAKLHEHAISI